MPTGNDRRDEGDYDEGEPDEAESNVRARPTRQTLSTSSQVSQRGQGNGDRRTLAAALTFAGLP